MINAKSSLRINQTVVEVYANKAEMGAAAATFAVALLRERIAQGRRPRIIVGTGPSQSEMIEALVTLPGVDWRRVEIFHMDEYVGLSAAHPASFRRWLKEHVADRVPANRVHYLAGDAPDADAECRSYAELLAAAPIDITFLGFGENGHIAFNDPHVADFHDPSPVKRVEMDRRCRLQQVGEGHFAKLEDVPREALTVTCPVLLSARDVVASVPDERKAEAVRNAIEGPLTTACPASAVFVHPRARVFLDAHSASLLRQERFSADDTELRSAR